ncbi:MAG: mannose-6-phosphate isomerase, class I, partial [Bacteroidota bacterium]
MANSDNVFRGGLTPKHIDVPELMHHLKTDAVVPKVFEGEQLTANERVYRTPAPDFEVSQIQLKAAQTYRRTSDAPDILIVLNGQVEVKGTDTAFNRAKGEVFFVSAHATYQLTAEEDTVLYRASVPV